MTAQPDELPSKTLQGLDLLRNIKRAFENFELVDLPRPPSGFSKALEALWGLSVYVHSAILHTSSLLGSFLRLADTGDWPAATIVARCVYELGAQSHYIHKHVSDWKNTNQLDLLWDFLTEINVGSEWMHDIIATRRPNPDDFEDFPVPRRIGRIMACFANEVEGERLANYKFLSEFAHPNFAAFSQHYDFDERVVRFRRTPSTEEFPVVVTLVLVAANTLIDRLNKLNSIVDSLSDA